MKQSFGYIMGMIFMLVLIVALPQIALVVAVLGLVGWLIYVTGGSGTIFAFILLLVLGAFSPDLIFWLVIAMILMFVALGIFAVIMFMEESDEEKAEWRKEHMERSKKKRRIYEREWT